MHDKNTYTHMEQMPDSHLTTEFHISDRIVLRIQYTCHHCFCRFLLFLKKNEAKILKCHFPDHKTSLPTDRYTGHQNNMDEPSKKMVLGESSTLTFVTPVL